MKMKMVFLISASNKRTSTVNSKYSEIISVKSCGESKKDIEIYPNPTNGVTLSGKINTKTTQPWSIVIYDKLGNVIMRTTFSPGGIYHILSTYAETWNLLRRFFIRNCIQSNEFPGQELTKEGIIHFFSHQIWISRWTKKPAPGAGFSTKGSPKHY